MLIRCAIAVLAIAVVLPAQDAKAKKFEMTKEVQQQIDEWKKTIAGWTGEPVITAAVAEQNKKGPLDGMDNKKWKALRRRAPEVEQFTSNAAAKALQGKTAATDGVVSEAFLNAKKGEKVAFLEKTSSYLHAGNAKFDVPFQKLQSWQGEPEFDESSQQYALQIAVPVLDPKNGKQAIGVLVVGLNLSQLTTGKPAPAK